MKTQNELSRMLRARQVCELLGVSKSALYRWVAAGNFPQQIKLGENSAAWDERDLVAWLEQRRGGA